MTCRVVVPEILDHLPAEDPEAQRSRRDLRRINRFMGNEQWLLEIARKYPDAAAMGITELGAGDGYLTRALAQEYPQSIVTALDLAPAPTKLPGNVDWRQGDMFSAREKTEGGILVANLFLHHFEGELLLELGRLAESYRLFAFSEPLRARSSHVAGYLAHPFLNRVTRHDMHVSIDAGFIHGELPELMGLTSDHWHLEEHSTWRGALRVLGWRD